MSRTLTFATKLKKFRPGSSLVLLGLVVVWLIPTVGLLITAFRSKDDAYSSGWWTALFSPFNQHWTIQPFSDALSAANMVPSFIATAAVAVPATVLPIMFAAFAAYGFTFLQFKGKEFWFSIIIGLMVVPMQAALVPVLQLFVGFDSWIGDMQMNSPEMFRWIPFWDENYPGHITGEYPAGWIVHSAFAMPLAVYILRNYMMTLPNALIEAARVDGASYYQIFWRLVIPMSVPALASFAIFQFLWVWNDYLVAFVFVGNHPVLTYTLLSMLGQYSQGWQIVAAGSFFTLIVPVVVFFGLQRFFVRGLTAGSVK
jgi:alpha-glucoside transport system permease protein